MHEPGQDWEARYRDDPGYRNRYPWSSVVSFVMQNAPKNVPAGSVSILEVGCGNGSNLWFAAREGFKVAGIDASQTAIAHAKKWFAREGLEGDFRLGDFSSLPFADAQFDLVIDRAALSFAPMTSIRKAVGEIHRVLRPGGKFAFNPYSDRCTSFDGVRDPDGYCKVTRGTLTPGVKVSFFGPDEVRELFKDHWDLQKMVHCGQTDLQAPERLTHAEWQVEAMKPGPADG